MKAMTNTIINSMMSNVVKYICAVVLLLGLSVNVWGGNVYIYPTGGTTSLTSGIAYSTGATVTFTVIPNSGYYCPTTFADNYGVEGMDEDYNDLEGLSCISHNTYSFTMPSKNAYVWVNFKAASAHSVTYNVPSCVTAIGTKNDFQFRSPSSADELAAFKFEGWTTSAYNSTTSPATLYAVGEAIPDNVSTVYAVYSSVNSAFSLKKSSPTSGGRYILSATTNNASSNVLINKTVSSSRIETGPIATTGNTITCEDWGMIWTFVAGTSSYSGYWFVYNEQSGQYLAASGTGDTSSSDRKMTLVDEPSSTAEKDKAAWSVDVSAGGNISLTNKARSSDTYKVLKINSDKGGFYSSGTSPYLFEQGITTTTYTTSPSCSALVYSVIYDANGGSGTMTDDNEYEFEGVAEAMTNTFTPPTGYTFDYWTADYRLETKDDEVEIGGRIDEGTQFFMPAADVTLTAQWTPNEITITLNKGTDGDEDGLAIVYYDATMLDDILDATHTETYYHLEGYYTDDATPVKVLTATGAFANSNIAGYVTGGKWSNTNTAITLYAHWELNTHSIHWYKNDESADDLTGSYTDGDNVAYGTTITAPNTPTFTGHTFTGWSETSSGSTVTPVTSMPDADKTYYAKWTPNSHTLTISSVDNVTISSSTPSVEEGSYTSVEYGSTVTLSKTSLTSGYYWGGWKVYKTDDTNTTVAVSNNQFTMPDYNVTVSAIIYPKAKLLTRCQNTVTYHYAGGTTSERVATGAHPTGYTPADCENKRFMGWTTSNMGSALTQVAPSMTDPTTVAVDGDLDYYAVYASPNGGKVTGIEKNHLDIINSGVWTVTDDVLSKADAYTSYTMGANVTYKPITRNSALYSVIEFANPTAAAPQSVTTGKIRNLSAVQFHANTAGCQFTYNIYVSRDGTAWTKIGSGKLSGNQSAVSSSKLSTPIVNDYYIKFELYKSSAVDSYNVGIWRVDYFTKSRSVWYSDYSNGCDVAGTATLTYKDDTTTVGTHAATPSVPEVYTVEEQAKAGYTFDYITVAGQTYAAGDKYLLAHDVDAVITWKENPTISGNVYATSANGVTVQASGSLTVTTTEDKTGTLTVESDNAKFVPTITSGASPSGEPLNAVVTWTYTPTEANIADETATLTATINGASSTITVHGRSLPENFAIVAQTTAGKWIALPNNAANGATAGIEIAVDNVANPTKVVLAPANTTFDLRKGYDNSSSSDDVTRVRFCANTTDATTLYATSGDDPNVQVYAKWSSGPTSDGYQWTMSTTDNKTYTLHNKASSADRDLGLSGSNWGAYKTGVRTVRFLPVDEEVAASSAIVEEWFPDKVRIHTSDVIESAKVAIGGIEGVSLSATTISGMGTNYYEITTASLQNYPGEELAIQYTTSSAVDYAIIYTIPLIIDETTSSSVIDKNYSNIDLIVRDGAVYTANHSTQVRNQYMNIWIYPTAKLVVPEVNTLKTGSLNLLGGTDWIGDGAGNYTLTKYAVPEFSLKGNLKDLAATPAPLTAATYYMRTDGNQYYLLAAPSTTTINASDIKRGNTETSLTLNDDLGLLKYDGARRSRGVAGSDNWIDANTLERGLGYWIAADPIDGETYSLLRMPMTIAESDQTVAVIAHAENASAAAVHKGWNFIANPFMTSVQTGALTFEGGATATNFVVTPDEENYTQSFYDTHLLVAEDYQLKPFKGYFVQVGTSGNLSFGASTRQAPARMAAQDTINEVLYTVTIAGGESKSGTMGFFIAPNYTDQYDIGFDFEWMPSAGQDAYALYNNTRLRYTALPAYLAKLAIPVAYTAREAGTYTWTLNAYTNGQDLEHVYLIDYELDVTHDLLTGPYEFTTAVQTENQTRFAIATEVGEHRAPTDVETVEEDSGGGGPVKFIYHDKMYILNDNVIYDATGKRVKVVANGQKGGAL